MASIKTNPYSIEYIREQTEELCLEAIKHANNDPCIWYCIPNKTYEICKKLVEQCGTLLSNVKEYEYKYLTPEVCALALDNAVQSKTFGVRHVLPYICYEKKDVHLILKFMKFQTDEVCLKIVRHNGNALQYVHNQTPEICQMAIRQCKSAQKYVQNRPHS